MEEKRQLLNFILQNLELKERKLMFKTKTPFDTVLLANKCPKVGLIVDAFRALDWSKMRNGLSNLGVLIKA